MGKDEHFYKPGNAVAGNAVSGEGLLQCGKEEKFPFLLAKAGGRMYFI
jgi:hypothetical protein